MQRVQFSPSEDITAYELALAMAVMNGAPLDSQPEGVQRHFQSVEIDPREAKLLEARQQLQADAQAIQEREQRLNRQAADLQAELQEEAKRKARPE